ncbi:MAG: zinc ribbon domain-containing protein [Clostridiaceae bacterium]
MSMNMNSNNEKVIKIKYHEAAAFMNENGANVLGREFFIKDVKTEKSVDAPLSTSARDILCSVTRPSLVSNIFIIDEDDSFICTRAAAGSDGKICFVSKQEDGFAATPVLERNEAFRGLQSRLDGGAPAADMDVSFVVSHKDLFVLAAAADLYVRKRMLCFLGHSAPYISLNSAEVLYMLEDGLASKDPRWLVYFFQMCMPYSGPEFDEQMVSQSLKQLSEIGLINRELSSLTDSGMLLGISHYRRLSMIGLNMAGAKEDGSLASQRSAFLRGDRLLWFIDDSTGSGGGVEISSISISKACSILNELFTPEGIPADADTESHAYMPQDVHEEENQFDTPKFCNKCGKSLKAGAKFCGSCGNEIKVKRNEA